MKLPNAECAEVNLRKLRNYCLSESHPEGRHKAKVFRTALGLTAADAEELKDALLHAAQVEEAVPGENDAYGQRFVVDFLMDRSLRVARVRSAWIVRCDEDFPRLTSCYVL